MKISVNVDDFGISEAVSRTIVNFIRQDYCDTTTVMVNMPKFKETFYLAEENGIADRVGLHLNLT